MKITQIGLVCLTLFLCIKAQIKKLQIFSLVELRIAETIGVGTPTQNFLCIYDTGSPYLYIPSSICDTCKRIDRQISKFDQKMSQTYEFRTQNAEVGYEENATGSGFEIRDIVTFDSWNVSMEGIYLINREYNMFSILVADAIMGLSNYQQEKNIFQLAKEKGILSSSLFAFYYGNTFLNQKSYFYYNFSKDYFQDLFYVSSENALQWSLPFSSVYMGEKKLHINQAVFDTGFSQIGISKQIYQEIYLEFFNPYCKKHDKNTLCSCDYQKFPDLQVMIGVNPFTEIFYLPSTIYLQSAQNMQHIKVPFSDKKGMCLLLIKQFDSFFSKHKALFGLPIFSGRRMVFDKENNQIGLGRQSVRLRNFISSPGTEWVLYIFSYFIFLLLGLFVYIGFIGTSPPTKKIAEEVSETTTNQNIQNQAQKESQ